MLKNPPVVQETWVWSLGWEDLVGKISWGRKCLLTPVFLPGESYGKRRVVGCSPWGCKNQAWLSNTHTHTHTHTHTISEEVLWGPLRRVTLSGTGSSRLSHVHPAPYMPEAAEPGNLVEPWFWCNRCLTWKKCSHIISKISLYHLLPLTL